MVLRVGSLQLKIFTFKDSTAGFGGYGGRGG